MKKNKETNKNFAHEISDEKLAEFGHMSLRARLFWLEEANMFVNKTIGLKKRAQFDNRFEVCLPKSQKKAV